MGGCLQSPYVLITHHDGRSSETLGTHRHQQYQYLAHAIFDLRPTSRPRDSAAKPIEKTTSSPPAYSLTWTHCGAPTPSTVLPCTVTHSSLATIPASETQPPKPWTTSLSPTDYGPRGPIGTTHLVRSFLTSSASYANLAPKQQSLRHTGPPNSGTNYCADYSTSTSCNPPSRDLFFPGKRGAYEGVGTPGWSVTTFHVPH
jgi:hypothetical protein